MIGFSQYAEDDRLRHRPLAHRLAQLRSGQLHPDPGRGKGPARKTGPDRFRCPEAVLLDRDGHLGLHSELHFLLKPCLLRLIPLKLHSLVYCIKENQ